MRVGVALARPGLGGAQNIALSVAAASPDAVLLAPGPFQIIEMATARGLAAEVIDAPAELLRYGGETARLSTSEQLRLFLRHALPFARVVARRLQQLGVSVLYAGEERSQVLMGMGAALCGIPTVWHLQGGIFVRAPAVQGLAAALASRIVCTSAAVEKDLDAFAGLIGESTHPSEVAAGGLCCLQRYRRAAAAH